MSEPSLASGLRDIAQEYLGRELQEQEQQQLLQFQISLQTQHPAGESSQLVRQAQQVIEQGGARTRSQIQNILESIQQSSQQALQVQKKEEQAIVKLLEGSQALADLRPGQLKSGMAGLQPGSQLALTQIAELLANLAKKEVETCFNQYFGPLTQQLRDVLERLQTPPSMPAAAPAMDETADDIHIDSAAASPDQHDAQADAPAEAPRKSQRHRADPST